MDDNVDTKQILKAFLAFCVLEETSRTTTVQNDLDSHRLSWTDAVNLVQNRPLWRLLATSGTTYSWWCKPEMMMIMIDESRW